MTEVFKRQDKYGKWDIRNMDTLLSKLADTMDGTQGITSEYVYFGMLYTYFVLHVEDYHLFSINYLHKGSPKYW